jgi:hypothetical protein
MGSLIIPKTTIEIIAKRYSFNRDIKGYFLYNSHPTKVRENWRNIRGFHFRIFGFSFHLCVWQ